MSITKKMMIRINTVHTELMQSLPTLIANNLGVGIPEDCVDAKSAKVFLNISSNFVPMFWKLEAHLKRLLGLVDAF